MSRVAGHTLPRRAIQEWWLLALVLLLWAALSALGWMPVAVFPDLQSLAATAKQLALGQGGVLGSLGEHVVASLLRFGAGVALSVVVGITLGLVMAASAPVAALALPLLRFLYPIPGLAWTPLVIMWCGLGETTVVVLILLSAVWPVLYGAYDGFRNIPAPYLRVARQLEASWPVAVRKVLLPAALPILISSLRIAHGVGWRAIIGAEMIAALSGLGYMLNMAGELRRPDAVVLGMIVIACISVVFDRVLFDPVERRLAKKGIG
jgi:NitT/TauT family transport system permease protein/taurine transport system permease protein